MSEIKRNFVTEAMAIITGESRILPEPEHLQALAAQMESVLKEKQLLVECLCAVMVDTQQKQLYFALDDLERVRAGGINFVVEPVKQTGAFIVRISRRPTAPSAMRPTGTPSVN